MPDELDDMIRGAMKVLDEGTPSGYFDAAPNQILAHLEDGSMQHGSSGMTDSRGNRDPQSLMGPPVTEPATTSAVANRDEDSGLHDIRNLAQSTKQRLSSKRQTVNPPVSDEDALTAASGSWKNIALPQPAKMVALPELEDLPSKQEVLAAQKAAKARKDKVSAAPAPAQNLGGDQDMAPAATASLAAMPVATAAEASAATPARAAFSLPSMERSKRSKGPLFAVVGLGVAAAAAGVFFMNSSKDQKASAPAVASVEPTTPAAPKVEAPAPAPTPAPVQAAGAGSAAEPAVAPAEEPKAPEVAAAPAPSDEKVESHGKRGAVKAALPSPKKGDADAEKTEAKPDAKPDAKEAKTDPKAKDDGKTKDGEGEPSFDALLKEAGVDDKKKEAKPKLDKTSLSSDDFKKGMATVNAAATGCYKGTQGTAIVKLTISPAGKVTKAAVTGAFAGKPEGTCVESAVKAATFPAWDGGPQTFNYSYMLSD